MRFAGVCFWPADVAHSESGQGRQIRKADFHGVVVTRKGTAYNGEDKENGGGTREERHRGGFGWQRKFLDKIRTTKDLMVG